MDFFVEVCPPFNVLNGQVSYNRDRMFENGYLVETIATVTCDVGAVIRIDLQVLTSYTYTCYNSSWGQPADCRQGNKLVLFSNFKRFTQFIPTVAMVEY